MLLHVAWVVRIRAGDGHPADFRWLCSNGEMNGDIRVRARVEEQVCAVRQMARPLMLLFAPCRDARARRDARTDARGRVSLVQRQQRAAHRVNCV